MLLIKVENSCVHARCAGRRVHTAQCYCCRWWSTWQDSYPCGSSAVKDLFSFPILIISVNVDVDFHVFCKLPKSCTLCMQRAISSKNCDGWFYIKQFNIFQTCLYGIRSLSVSAQTGKILQTPWYCQSIINLIRALINIGSGWMYSFLKYEGDRAEYFSLLKINYFSYAF